MDVMLDGIANIPAETLIEAGLNVVGFLAAGGLLLMISGFLRGRRSRAAEAGVIKATMQPAQSTAVAEPRKSSPSFVSLSFTRKAPTETAKSPAAESPQEATRRNRAEVIQLAKRMIAARESREAIASKLPISEAELAMLSEQ